LGANTQPSAIAVDSILGYAAVAEAGTNTVQFLNLSTDPPTLSAAFPVANPAANNLPTGVAIDRNDCTSGAAGVCSVRQAIVAVVNYQAQTMSILTIPGGTFLESIPLNNLIPPSQPSGTNANPSPNPYSVGIDPFTHRALVAFASTNAGFVVNLDQSQKPSICLPGFAPADGTSYCPVALVTLNTGTNPQIAFEPGAHLAYVSPGGQAGALSAVSLTNPSQGPLQIASAVRTANLVTVTMAAGMPDNIVPGTSPTILISGLPLGTAGSSFNGAFPVSTVLSNLSFTYVQTGPDDTATSTTSQQGFLTIGNDTITYAINPSLQGIDINPITHSAVLANPNAAGSINSGPQITFINSLDESLSSLSLCNDNNLAIVTPALACGPEQGISAVAYQPFTNTVVSLRYDLNNLYNNQISLLDPSALNRVTMVPTGQMAAVATSFTPPGSSSPLMLNGAIAVDPIHNLALAVNSGSGTITPLYLGNIKPLQIQSVSTPPVDATDGATTPALIAQSVLFQSSTPAQPVSGVQVFGRGFNGSSQVRLDGVPLPPSDVSYSSSKPNELDVTIPVTNGSQGILTAPHNFALDVANTDGTTSNVMDFRVVEAIPIPQCSGVNAAPGGVAIADDLVGTTKNYAVVTETACSQVGVISLNNDGTFGSITTIATGTNPTGVATIPRFGYAVVTNNAMSGTASILDLTTGTRAAGATTDVTVGSFPTGVAIEQETGLAVVANTSSNTATVIDLTPLKASPVGTLAPLTTATDQEPIAVAIDPDRGTNATGLAVITALNISSTPASGALDPIDISLATPAKVNTEVLTVDTIPSGIIFDPFASPATLFYAAVSDDNALISFNPDTGSTSTAQVGINPYSVAYNPQTSSILTVNSASNTISIIDSLTFQTKATIGIGGVSLFSAAIEPLSNLAVIADQANNRVLLFPMPH
jgi:DNA-binding beta-propeller fold protein YncE